MTPTRALHLIAEHGCRLGKGSRSCLIVINEALNFKYTLPMCMLANIDEEAFIATITTGHTKRGQKALPGHYQDYRPPPLRDERVISLDDLPAIPERPFLRRGKVTQKLLRPGQDTLPNVVILDPFTPEIPPSRALQKESFDGNK